jgi:hypothetical protein
MPTGTQDNENIIERVAALDIGKAELVCWIPRAVPRDRRFERDSIRQTGLSPGNPRAIRGSSPPAWVPTLRSPAGFAASRGGACAFRGAGGSHAGCPPGLRSG